MVLHVECILHQTPALWQCVQNMLMTMGKLFEKHCRQFGGHKNRENKSLKIELSSCRLLNILSFTHVRLTIPSNSIFTLLDKQLYIYLMQNFRPFTYLMLRGV